MVTRSPRSARTPFHLSRRIPRCHPVWRGRIGRRQEFRPVQPVDPAARARCIWYRPPREGDHDARHENQNQSCGDARAGAHADWRHVDGPTGRGGTQLLRPGRKARVTSTPPPALPAWPRTAPRARCTPPTTARSTRSCASRTARPWTSASSSPSRRRSRMRADTPTRPRRTRSAPTRTAGSPRIYDQSPKHNDLTQAPRGGFSGPAMGGFNNLPIADMAPITIMGHKAYGVFIAPGMGLRNNDTERHRGRRPGRRAVLGHQRPALQLRLLLRLRQRRDRQPRRRQRHHGDHLLRQRHRLVSRARRPARGS